MLRTSPSIGNIKTLTKILSKCTDRCVPEIMMSVFCDETFHEFFKCNISIINPCNIFLWIADLIFWYCSMLLCSRQTSANRTRGPIVGKVQHVGQILFRCNGNGSYDIRRSSKISSLFRPNNCEYCRLSNIKSKSNSKPHVIT